MKNIWTTCINKLIEMYGDRGLKQEDFNKLVTLAGDMERTFINLDELKKEVEQDAEDN